MRLLSYNIRGGLGMDDRRSIARIARVIQEHEPDVVCLQEVHRRLPWSGLSDQPRLLARHTGLHLSFLPNFRVGIGGYGNCVLSREPIQSRALHLLPSRKEQRGAIAVEVPSNGATFTVVCTHFGLDAEERQAQARSVDEIGRAARYPCVIAGDLNEGPDGPALRWLEAAGWRHASPPVEPTFTSTAPRVRIDYVLMGSGVRCERGWVGNSQASDHLPVGVEVFLEWSTTHLQRALLWAFLATLIALIGVTTVAWIRRPKTAPPPAALVRRGAFPVLANDPDGSVYDLNLRIAEMQARLNESETLVVTQQKRLDEAQHERTQLQKKVQDLAGEIKELRTAFEKSQREPARTATPETGESTTPPPTPPGGALPTPNPPSPAAPP